MFIIAIESEPLTWGTIGTVAVAVLYGIVVGHERYVRPWIERKNAEKGNTREQIAMEKVLAKIREQSCPVDLAKLAETHSICRATHDVSRETSKAVGELAGSVNKLAALVIEAQKIGRAVHAERIRTESIYEEMNKMRHDTVLKAVRDLQAKR